MPGGAGDRSSRRFAGTRDRRSAQGRRGYAGCLGRRDRGEPAGADTRVSEMLDALEVVAGRAARERVRFEKNQTIAKMVGGWASAFESARARRLGLAADPDFISIIRQFQREQGL